MSEGTIDPTTGLYRPVKDGAGDINPYRDSSAWNRCSFASKGKLFYLPGLVASVEGNDRIEKWFVQKAPNVAYAVTVWRGTELCESIKITCHLPTEGDFDQWSEMRRFLQPGPQNTVWYITFPPLNFAGLTRVGIRKVGTPRAAPGLSWDATIELIEYRPAQKIVAGPPDPPKIKSQLAQENDALASSIDNLSRQIWGSK